MCLRCTYIVLSCWLSFINLANDLLFLAPMSRVFVVHQPSFPPEMIAFVLHAIAATSHLPRHSWKAFARTVRVPLLPFSLVANDTCSVFCNPYVPGCFAICSVSTDRISSGHMVGYAVTSTLSTGVATLGNSNSLSSITSTANPSSPSSSSSSAVSQLCSLGAVPYAGIAVALQVAWAWW